jgi:hypothetical protein
VRAAIRSAVGMHWRVRALARALAAIRSSILSALRSSAPESAASVRVRRAFDNLRVRSEVKWLGVRGAVEGGGTDHAFARWRLFLTLRVCIATRAALVADYRYLRGLTFALRAWHELSLLQTVFDSWRNGV